MRVGSFLPGLDSTICGVLKRELNWSAPTKVERQFPEVTVRQVVRVDHTDDASPAESGSERVSEFLGARSGWA